MGKRKQHEPITFGKQGVSSRKLGLFFMQDCRCFYCNRKLDPPGQAKSWETQPTRDHVIPLSKGGHRSDWNTVYACIKCNQAKADRMPSKKIVDRFIRLRGHPPRMADWSPDKSDPSQETSRVPV